MPYATGFVLKSSGATWYFTDPVAAKKNKAALKAKKKEEKAAAKAAKKAEAQSSKGKSKGKKKGKQDGEEQEVDDGTTRIGQGGTAAKKALASASASTENASNAGAHAAYDSTRVKDATMQEWVTAISGAGAKIVKTI